MTCNKPLDMLLSDKLVTVAAPMVRYSKLAFRTLVRKYEVDIAYTPMIMSDSFVKSVKARDIEFTTSSDDSPLIVQFAANNPTDFADAAEIVRPYCDGVDLNCGCPQRWAFHEGIGVCLMNKPEVLSDIVSQTRSRISDPDFTVSVKVRIHSDLRRTVDLCQKVERAGASWLTVHGRTATQRCEPVDTDAIRVIKDSVSVPVVANGDICSIHDAAQVHKNTNVNGVMAARGLLSNPALFAGYEKTPLQCVQDWVDIALSLGTPFQLFHHHLSTMLEHVMSRNEKRIFNCLGGMTAVLDFLKENYGIR